MRITEKYLKNHKKSPEKIGKIVHLFCANGAIINMQQEKRYLTRPEEGR